VFGKILGGKGWFSCGVKVKVRFLSWVVEIGEEIVVFGLDFWGIRIWWILVMVDESCF